MTAYGKFVKVPASRVSNMSVSSGSPNLAPGVVKMKLNENNSLIVHKYTCCIHSQSGSRVIAPKIAIVLTDGQSTEPSLTGPAAVALREAGVVVFAIGR